MTGTKGNAILKTQFAHLVAGLTAWRGEVEFGTHPLQECNFNYLAFKLQVLDRLRHYLRLRMFEEANEQLRPKLFYICSGSDEFCRIIESIGFSVTTLDMACNEYSGNHIEHYLRDDSASLELLRKLIVKNDFILWDTSIGHLDGMMVKKVFSHLKDKTYLLGLYDVPKEESFGPKVRNHEIMVNILKNSPRRNADLYSDVLKDCSLHYTIDLGAFSILLYDNIPDFPLNDITIERQLDYANM